jgi:virulence-associated protein VapD
VSDNSFSNTEIANMMYDLIDKYPYLEKCVRDIRVANIIDINSLNYIFDYDGTPGKFADYD